MEGETMPGSGNLDILTWRERLLAKEEMKGTTPLEVAAELKKNAGAALAGLAELRRAAGNDRELRLTLGDMEAMAHLGNYYSAKILGAAELALFDATGEAARREAAVKHLNQAANHWRQYAGVYGSQYKPQLLNRVGFIDIPALSAKADADVEMARQWKAGTVSKRAGKMGQEVTFRPERLLLGGGGRRGLGGRGGSRGLGCGVVAAGWPLSPAPSSQALLGAAGPWWPGLAVGAAGVQHDAAGGDRSDALEGDLGHDDGADGFVVTALGEAGDFADEVLTLDHLAEDGVLAVEVGRGDLSDEELRGTGAGAGVGHGEAAGDVELERGERTRP